MTSEGKRLLVMDDDPAVRTLVRNIAEVNDFEVAEASDDYGFEAARRSLDPTHIVLDIVMPEVDGIELLMRLLKQQTTARLILMSGYNPSYLLNARKIATALGATKIAVVEKPFTVETFEDALLNRA